MKPTSPALRFRRPQRAVLILVCLLTGLPGAALAAAMSPDRVERADFSGKPPAEAASPLGVRVQVLLDRAHFSPGEIDGRFGENVQKALRAYAEAHQLPTTTKLTPGIWQKLSADTSPVLTRYTITDKDVRGPFLKKLPAKMEAMRSLPALSYTSARQELAEKFHMSETLLAALNPGDHFDRAGTTIVVANVNSPDTAPVQAARVVIDKSRQTVEALDQSGGLIAFYPATVGSEEKPSPSGTLKVAGVSHNPTYHYNPRYHFKDVHTNEPFTIKSGPNNPVGSVWIDLTPGEGYGIHGTADPGKVSKAQSHGCVRLTNWDAEQLAGDVREGTPVEFVEGEKT